VYEVLRRTPGDFAVLEWPMLWSDAKPMLWALYHRKRLVNGWSGVRPGLEAEISGAVSEEGQDPFPSLAVYRRLREIFPLRYIVVEPARLTSSDRARWAELQRGRDPRLRFIGHFERQDLFEIPPLPERGPHLERWVSYDFLRSHPVMQVRLRPLVGGPHIEQWVDVTLNDEPVARIPLHGGSDAVTVVSLVSPLRHVMPNVITLHHAYRRPAAALDARYRIGTTQMLSPADLRVRSGGQPHGDLAAIEVDGAERAPGRRGYNLVALDTGGRLVGAEVFDTFGSPQAARDLAVWVAGLSTGTIVAGAVKDEGSERLTEDAVRALGTLGVTGDLRGRFRESHAFVGVKGEPAGSALEALGPMEVKLVVGRLEPGLGFELTKFGPTPSRGGDAADP
jgi:Interleukin-like EMT inducer